MQIILCPIVISDSLLFFSVLPMVLPDFHWYEFFSNLHESIKIENNKRRKK